MKRPYVIHPILFAIYPVAALLSFNINEVTLAETVRMFLLAPLVAVVLLAILKLLLRDWHKAAMLATLYLICFFGYNHIVRSARRLMAPVADISYLNFHLLSLSLWAVVLIVGSWWLWRIVKRDLRPFTSFLNVTSAVILILPLGTIVWETAVNRPLAAPEQATSSTPTIQTQDLPDIYYIIMDGYTRADIMQDIIGYDNSLFIDFLAENGFYVAPQSHSNYAQTRLSLASSLNYEYINYVAEELGPDSQNYTPLINLIQDNQLKSFLADQGYQTFAFATGFAPTELKNSDHFFSSDASVINSFEALLINDTIIGIFLRSDLQYEMRRRRILYAFNSLMTVPTMPGNPKFVFFHVVSPHPPFVFGPNGEPVSPGTEYTVHDGIASGLSREVYTQSYSDQVNYLNSLLKEVVTTILAESPQPPIIIIQGDHGSGTYWDITNLEESCAHERMSILNAYHVPENIRAQLYDTITPVNTFRIILDSYFETNLGTLEDRSYFPGTFRPYDLTFVNDQLTQSCEG